MAAEPGAKARGTNTQEHASVTRTEQPALSTRHAALSTRVAGAAIALLGGWFLWQAVSLREGPGYAAVGPRVFPVIVGLGFLVSGLPLLLSRGRRARAHAPPDESADTDLAPPIDWPTLASIAVLLALYIALFLHLGFIISSAGFLVGGAWILGSRSWVRDVAAGFLLSVATYVVFTKLLGLELPAGPLEEPIRALEALFPQTEPG
jgi:putative tricarboxylic transport membrane protein